MFKKEVWHRKCENCGRCYEVDEKEFMHCPICTVELKVILYVEALEIQRERSTKRYPFHFVVYL